MEQKIKTHSGSIAFFTLTALLFAGGLLFFSFTSPLDGGGKKASQKEIDKGYVIVGEKLLTPLNDPFGPYNYSTPRGGMMSRAGTSRSSLKYQFVFQMKEEPLCDAHGKVRILCGNLISGYFGIDNVEPIPVEIDLQNSSLLMEWEGKKMTDKTWLAKWEEVINEERPTQRITFPQSGTEKLSIPDESRK